MGREFFKRKLKWPINMKNAQLSRKYKLKQQDHLFTSEWQKFRSFIIPSVGGIVRKRVDAHPGSRSMTWYFFFFLEDHLAYLLNF